MYTLHRTVKLCAQRRDSAAERDHIRSTDQ